MSPTHEHGHGEMLAIAAGKATPPLAVTLASVAGLGFQDWVYILTIIYLVLQIVLTGKKLFIEWKDKRGSQ